MKNLHTFEEFLGGSLNEGDMSREYDGFVVLDYKSKKQYKFRYSRGNNVPQENDAIAKMMKSTRLPRSSFAVNGFVRKGEYDRSEFPEFED
jgi:hypothetical protein